MGRDPSGAMPVKGNSTGTLSEDRRVAPPPWPAKPCPGLRAAGQPPLALDCGTGSVPVSALGATMERPSRSRAGPKDDLC